MSINSITGQNVARSLGSFASSDRPLSNDAFGVVLTLLGPKELVCMGEKLCKTWREFLSTVQWKKECKLRLNVCANIDPKNFLPKDVDYKKGAFLASPKLFDSRLVEDYLPVKMGPVPSISEDTLVRSGELDPCDKTATIGQNFTWIDIPEYYEIPDPANFPYVLEDASNEEDLPRLVPKKEGDLVSKEPLKVVPTIHNIGILFAHPKKGNPSAYDYIWNEILKQHGNKAIPPGRVCMREGVIEKDQSFPQQLSAATQLGVVISPLGHRIIFNFLKHVSSEKANGYPDGSLIFARTSTLTANAKGIIHPSGCRAGDSPGLSLSINSDEYYVGIAVSL